MRAWCQYLNIAEFAFCRDYYCTSRLQFGYLLLGDIEGGHYCSTLRCGYHYFVILVIVTRAYAVRVSHYKTVAIADKAAEYIAAVKVSSGLLQYTFYIQCFRISIICEAKIVVYELYHSAQVAFAQGA